MLAELVDAVVGVDTHRDTHQVEIADRHGTPIAICSITNDTTGYAQLLAWIFDHAPAHDWWCRSKEPAAMGSD
jgi:transposase